MPDYNQDHNLLLRAQNGETSAMAELARQSELLAHEIREKSGQLKARPHFEHAAHWYERAMKNGCPAAGIDAVSILIYGCNEAEKAYDLAGKIFNKYGTITTPTNLRLMRTLASMTEDIIERMSNTPQDHEKLLKIIPPYADGVLVEPIKPPQPGQI